MAILDGLGEQQLAALLEDREQLIQLWTGDITGQSDSNGMKQLLPFEACLGFDSVYDYLPVPNDVTVGSRDLFQKFTDHGNGAIFVHGLLHLQSRKRRDSVEFDDGRCLPWELGELVNPAQHSIDDQTDPYLYSVINVPHQP